MVGCLLAGSRHSTRLGPIAINARREIELIIQMLVLESILRLQSIQQDREENIARGSSSASRSLTASRPISSTRSTHNAFSAAASSFIHTPPIHMEHETLDDSTCASNQRMPT